MHKFLKSIGFRKITSDREWNKILRNIEDNFSDYERIALEEGLDYCELRKEFGSQIGVSSFGQIDEEDRYTREYYVPYLRGTGITTCADVLVDRRSDKEAYIGICEDARIGSTLIFHLQNGIEYMVESDRGLFVNDSSSVTLSGLANEGVILLPVMKSKKQEDEWKAEQVNRNKLVDAARGGNAEAIESLTMDDIDIYTEVSVRLQNEDVYTIIDTYFMPYGAECDKYAILGEIINMSITVNAFTEECIYIFTLDVNGMQFDVSVPFESLIGEPEIGRRLKADIWLQGYINF